MYVNIVQNRIETHDDLLIIQATIITKQYVHNCLTIFSEGRIVEPSVLMMKEWKRMFEKTVKKTVDTVSKYL